MLLQGEKIVGHSPQNGQSLTCFLRVGRYSILLSRYSIVSSKVSESDVSRL